MEELLSIINGDNKTFIRQNTMLCEWGEFGSSIILWT